MKITRNMTTNNPKTITKYYFIVKSTQNTWVPILTPFVTSGNGGEFLSSSWYKNAIPEEYECAVIRITINISGAKKQLVDDAMRLLDCVSTMNDNDGHAIDGLDFVIMRHFMKKKYLQDVHQRLRKLLENNNSDTATTHAVMQTASGTFGMSFGVRKNEEPHMYCPSFALA